MTPTLPEALARVERLDSFVDGMAHKRLTYADLIAKPEGN